MSRDPTRRFRPKGTMTSTDFGTLGVPSALVATLAADGKTTAFPIQADTLPDSLAGRDVLGRGRTGSGKTLAFALPLVTRLAPEGRAVRARPTRPRALVLAPTRELATQIAATVAPLADVYGLRTTTVFGGVSPQRQVTALRAGVEILVACPGRLEDLIGQRAVDLGDVEVTVIDEADHMADLGFLPVVTRILSRTPRSGQRLLFSATLDNGVDVLVKRFLERPVLHSVDEVDAPVAAMTHHVLEVADADGKRAVVQELASGTGRRILFSRTKHHAKKLARQLTAAGIPAVDLHGNLSQPQRDRNLAAFASGAVRVLVATDVAARGVHVDDVELVVHVDPPAEHKAYVHRSGRTARAGAEGDVVTIMLPEQRGDVLALLRKAAIAVRPQSATAGSPAVAALVGEVAAHVAPSPAPPARGSQPPRERARVSEGRGGPAVGGPAGAPASGSRRRRGGRGRASGGAVATASASSAQQPAARAQRSRSVYSTGSGTGGAYVAAPRTGGERRSRRAQSQQGRA